MSTLNWREEAIVAHEDKACEGHETRDACNGMRACYACEREVRWDLIDSPFFGFQNCEYKTAASARAASDPSEPQK